MYTNYKKFQDISRKQSWLNEGKKNGWLKSTMVKESDDLSDDNIVKSYYHLCDYVKHQIESIEDLHNFDFTHLNETIMQLMELHDKILNSKKQ